MGVWHPASSFELLLCCPETSPILISALFSSALKTKLHKVSKTGKTKHDSLHNHNEKPGGAAHPGLVKCVVLQSEEAASLAALQGWGWSRGQQVGRMGDHGWVWRGGECSCQREALQLPLSLLLQHLAHHHLLLLGKEQNVYSQDTCETGRLHMSFCLYLFNHRLHKPMDDITAWSQSGGWLQYRS